MLRTVLAGLVAAPIVLLTRQALPVGRHRRLLLLISAVSGFVAFPLLFTLGQQRTSAMHGNMILAALPICTGGVRGDARAAPAEPALARSAARSH